MVWGWAAIPEPFPGNSALSSCTGSLLSPSRKGTERAGAQLPGCISRRASWCCVWEGEELSIPVARACGALQASPSPGLSLSSPLPPTSLLPMVSRNVLVVGRAPRGAENLLIVSGCTVEAVLYLILYKHDLPSWEEILLPLQSQIHLSAQLSDSCTWKMFF